MKYGRISILTGAGISAESGLLTFRDNNGLWENHRVEDVATPQAFARNPELVQRFYNLRRTQLNGVQPNAANYALARLEHELPGTVTLITQNVDDLHERAGSSNLIHMHGELRKIRCVHCDLITGWQGDCTQESACPSCGRTPALRPHIVWFGEMPLVLDEIYESLTSCDLFIAIGTSGNVYPAAGFVSEVRQAGRAHTIEINLEPSMTRSYFAEHRHGKAGELVPRLVDELLLKS